MCNHLRCCGERLAQQGATVLHKDEQLREAVVHVSELCVRAAVAAKLVLAPAGGQLQPAFSMVAALAAMEDSLDPTRPDGLAWPHLLRDPGVAEAALRRVEACLALADTAVLQRPRAELADLGCVIMFHARSVGTKGDSLVSTIDFDWLQRLEDEAVSAGYTLSRSGDSDVTRLARECLLRVMDMACSTQQWTSFLATSNVGIASIADGLPTAAVWAAALGVGAVFDMYNVWHVHLSSAVKLKAHLEELQPAEWQQTRRVVLDQVAKLAAITVRVGGALLARLGMSEACSAGLRAIRRIGAGAAADLAAEPALWDARAAADLVGEQAWGAARAAGHLAAELAAACRGREKVLATVSAIVNSWAEGEGEAREPALQRVGGVAAAADGTQQPHD